MGIDLAFLAIDRAPFRGRLYTCLLIVALDADARDIVKMSHDSLAWQARISRRNAQEAMIALEQARLLTRFRWGTKKNPTAIWFQFHRAELYGFPRRGLHRTNRKELPTKVTPRRVGGLSRANQEKRVAATIHAAAEAAAARIRAFRDVQPGQQLAFLRSLRH